MCKRAFFFFYLYFIGFFCFFLLSFRSVSFSLNFLTHTTYAWVYIKLVLLRFLCVFDRLHKSFLSIIYRQCVLFFSASYWFVCLFEEEKKSVFFLCVLFVAIILTKANGYLGAFKFKLFVWCVFLSPSAFLLIFSSTLLFFLLV